VGAVLAPVACHQKSPQYVKVVSVRKKNIEGEDI